MEDLPERVSSTSTPEIIIIGLMASLAIAKRMTDRCE